MNIGDWREFTSILDMQIRPWRPCLIKKSADFRSHTYKKSEGVQKKNCKDRMNIDNWRAFTSILKMQNWRLENVYIVKLLKNNNNNNNNRQH